MHWRTYLKGGLRPWFILLIRKLLLVMVDLSRYIFVLNPVRKRLRILHWHFPSYDRSSLFFSLLQKCILPATLFKYFLAAGLVLVCAKNASFYSEEEFFSKICPFSFFHISFLSRFNIMYIFCFFNHLFIDSSILHKWLQYIWTSW